MARNAPLLLVSEQMEVDMARSPLSFYGIDEKYLQKGYVIYCVNCNKIEQERKTFKICMKCKQLKVKRWEPIFHYYCSKDCQKEYWKYHRLEHVRYEKRQAYENMDKSKRDTVESDEQKAEIEAILPIGPLSKVLNNKVANEPCRELEEVVKAKSDGVIVKNVVMVERATSPISADLGIPDKVQFNISAGTSSARFCLGQKITRSEGGVETSTVALLKQETTAEGVVNATTTPVYVENVIHPKNKWRTQIPMGKHPSKQLEYRGKKQDASTSPPQKGDLKAPTAGKKSTRKSGRGSGKSGKKNEETVTDVSDIPPSKVSSEPFWKPDITLQREREKKALPAPPSGTEKESPTEPPTVPKSVVASVPSSVSVPEKEVTPPTSTTLEKNAPTTPSTGTAKKEVTASSSVSSTKGATAVSSSVSNTVVSKEVAKPKKKKEHQVKDVTSLSNKFVTVVDVNECPPLEPKHFQSDSSSSGEDAGGYMMYIITDEVDGTRSAVLQKRKLKHKKNFNPRILFEKEHMRRKRMKPRRDGKPRQDITFHISHPSDEEDDEEDDSASAKKGSVAGSSAKPSKAAGKTPAIQAVPKSVKTGSSNAVTKVERGATKQSSVTSKEQKGSDSSSRKEQKTPLDSSSAQTMKPTKPESSHAVTEVENPSTKQSGSKKEELKEGSATSEKAQKTQPQSAVTATKAEKNSEQQDVKKSTSSIKSEKVAEKIRVDSVIKVDQVTTTVEVLNQPTAATAAPKDEAKVKFDPSVVLQTICEKISASFGEEVPLRSIYKKIDEAYGEEMPRLTRCVEVTASDDEIEQMMSKKSSHHIDKIRESYMKDAVYQSPDTAEDFGSHTSRRNSNNSNGSTASAGDKTSPEDAVPKSAAEESQDVNESLNDIASLDESSTNAIADSVTSDGDEYVFDTPLSKVKRTEGLTDGEVLEDLACLEGPVDSSIPYQDSRHFVLKNGGYDGQDIDIEITRTRGYPQQPSIEEKCLLKFSVTRKVKVKPAKSANIYLDMVGRRCSVMMVGGQTPASPKAPMVEYDMSSQAESDPDLKSNGNFRVLNSDKVFGDIYSPESVSQLSNPSLDITTYVLGDKVVTLDAPPKEEQQKQAAGKKRKHYSVSVKEAPYLTSLCTEPKYPTLIVMKKGHFDFVIHSDGTHRTFTRVFASMKIGR